MTRNYFLYLVLYGGYFSERPELGTIKRLSLEINKNENTPALIDSKYVV